MDSKRKEQQARYAKSAKGVAARRRAQEKYEHSRKGRARKRRYFNSSKGQEALATSKARRS